MSNTDLNHKNFVQNNSDILFIYDAKMTNPNGDPDDENKPRMDYERSRNLVSDVRLKRYIRDYISNLKDKDGNILHDIFVRQIDDKTVDATNRLKKLIEQNIDEIKKNKKMDKLYKKKRKEDDEEKDQFEFIEKELFNHLEWMLDKLIDVRLFGATMPIKAETGKGSSITFTGPVQFNWGYSINKVTGVMDSNTITSTFAGASQDESTMGKDYRVAYSILAFHGIVSANRAKYPGGTNLLEEDIKLLDKSLINILKSKATTRSKIGQEPQLYIRVEYKSDDYFIGDLRKYVKLADNDGNEIPFDKSSKLDRGLYRLDISELVIKLNKKKDKIKTVHYWYDEDIKIHCDVKDHKVIGIEDIISDKNRITWKKIEEMDK